MVLRCLILVFLIGDSQEVVCSGVELPLVCQGVGIAFVCLQNCKELHLIHAGIPVDISVICAMIPKAVQLIAAFTLHVTSVPRFPRNFVCLYRFCNCSHKMLFSFKSFLCFHALPVVMLQF